MVGCTQKMLYCEFFSEIICWCCCMLLLTNLIVSIKNSNTSNDNELIIGCCDMYITSFIFFHFFSFLFFVYWLFCWPHIYQSPMGAMVGFFFHLSLESKPFPSLLSHPSSCFKNPISHGPNIERERDSIWWLPHLKPILGCQIIALMGVKTERWKGNYRKPPPKNFKTGKMVDW